jgi:hypothetical protein
VTLADDALDPVDELDGLDATLEDGEQRPLAALVRRVLTRDEADIRRHLREPLTPGAVESRKERDRADLLRRHHVRQSVRRGVAASPGPRGAVGDLGLAENIPFRSGERERIENVGADANAARGIGLAVVREAHNPSLPRALSWGCSTLLALASGFRTSSKAAATGPL